MNHDQPLPPATSWTEDTATAAGTVRTGPPVAAPAAATVPQSTPAPSWLDCQLFCIGDYAGVGGRRCGWRGKIEDTRWDPSRRVRPCPRCGDATLMELDFARDHLRE